MKRSLTDQRLRTLFWRRCLEGFLSLLLIAGLWWVAGQAGQARQRLFEYSARLEQVPEQASARAMLAAELQKRTHDIDRLQAFVVPRHRVGEVVTALEAAGQEQEADVRVVRVVEEPVYGPDGNLITPTGPFVDVRLSVIAFGQPVGLLRFLHAAEHLPYLATVREWRLASADATRLPAGSQALSPARELGTPSAAPKQVAYQLELSVVLSIVNDYGQE